MNYLTEKIDKTIKEIEALDFLGHVERAKAKMTPKERDKIIEIQKKVNEFRKSGNIEGLKKYRDHIVKQENEHNNTNG